MQGGDRTSTHQYLVRRYGNKSNGQYFDFDEILAQISDVFCIICESYIPDQQIDQHSKECNGQYDQIEYVDQLQQKLQKCNYLINRIKKLLKTYSLDQQSIIQYTQLLWKCTSDILTATDLKPLALCIQDLYLFEQFFDNQQDIQIDKILQQIMTILSKITQFSNRKMVILEQNQPTVIDHLKDSVANSLANEGAFKQVIHETQLSRYRNPFENVQNNIHQSLKNTFNSRQVSNNNNNNKPINQYYLSPVEENSYISNPLMQSSFHYTNTSQINNKSQIGNESDSKSQFFKIAAQLKKKYPHKKQVQQALIIALFDQAKKQQVDQYSYEDYIDQVYTNM